MMLSFKLQQAILTFGCSLLLLLLEKVLFSLLGLNPPARVFLRGVMRVHQAKEINAANQHDLFPLSGSKLQCGKVASVTFQLD